MEEARTDEEVTDIKEALKLIEVIVLGPGPEVWAEALMKSERAVPLGLPESVYNFHQKQTAPLLNLVFQKVFLYGLRALVEEVGPKELIKRQEQLKKFSKGGQDAG